MGIFDRRNLLLNEHQIKKIENAKVAIFGLGGVGGFAFDSLVRMGIKDFILCDGDRFTDSNLNRQLLSNKSNIGRLKVDVAKEYALNINECISIKTYPFFLNSETINELNLKEYYIVDMIDDVKAKIELIKYASLNNNKIISMMGAGNRLNATFIVSDINKTENDPLAKKIRYELKKEEIYHSKVVYTKDNRINTESTTIGSISYVVGMAGLKIAEEVIKDIIN